MLHSGLEAGTVVAFLHENMLHFVADTAIADAADALAYLGDAGAPMLTSPRCSCTRALHNFLMQVYGPVALQASVYLC